MAENAKFNYKEKSVELTVTKGTFDEKGIDISKLRASTGLITYDPGYVNTGACESAVTYLNGEEGILLYRGRPIEQLADKSNFLETAYLLIYGKLPNKDEFKYFTGSINNHSMVHESIKNFYNGMPASAHPMAVCRKLLFSAN